MRKKRSALPGVKFLIFFETVQHEHINDDVVEIENYDPLGGVEVYKQEEEEE